jgi:hypothetical protein
VPDRGRGEPSKSENVPRVPYKSPSALDAIGRFLKCTDYEFECTKIAGRKFESIGDHAGYLGDGGCAKVLDVLAAS